MSVINAFPGYSYEYWESDKTYHNMFRGEDVGKGGYVWAKPGMYGRTVTLDVSGMHPSSIIALNYFGEYTQRYKDLIDTRAAIKHGDFDTASKMFDGKLTKYLTDHNNAKSLSNALKIAQNSCYGLTSAKFDNPMKHPKNVNNVVALRGALFMVTLKEEVIKRGGQPIHCKTDSIKLVEPTDELIEFVLDFGKKYGYSFEVEHTFKRICLVNKSTYVALLDDDDPDAPGQWTATAAQFAVPYVFKKLFSKEKIEFDDLCETKEVKTAMYLDMNENLVVNEDAEKELVGRLKLGEDPEVKSDYIAYLDPTFMNVSTKELATAVEKGHNRIFIGKVGQFCPIKPGCGGGVLLRQQNGKFDAVTGTKGYRWLESEMVRELGKEADIDRSYYDKLVDDAVDTISKYGDFEMFVSED